MIKRYTRPEMGEIWNTQSRFQCLLEVEVAVAKVQAELAIIPKKAAQDIERKADFSVDRIEQIERTTKHDVIAFVTNMAENVGANGRFIHYGMTSSDVLDTAMSLQIQKAWPVLSSSFQRLRNALSEKVNVHRHTQCAGRTHGMHAEATTFGLKLAGHFAEFQRAFERVEQSIRKSAIVKLSGAVGTYSTQPMEVERRVGDLLGLTPETIATQVVPRDRHAELIWSLAMLGAAVERLAIELRHLQRTEVGEVIENFTPGQKGSSAMPHKKNPISAENLTGLSRLLRAYADASIENIALWHERDISHSSVERVVFPDAFILADYGVDRLAQVIEGLYVDQERMLKNMNLSQGQLYSSQVLLALITKGLSREDAYKLVQKVCHGLDEGDSLEERLNQDKQVGKYLSASDIRSIFSGDRQRAQIDKIIERVIIKKKGRHGR